MHSRSAAPLRNYVANVRLRRVTDDDTCLWEWRASFDPPPQDRVRLERFVREEIIEAGFAGLRRALTAGERAAYLDRTSAPSRPSEAPEGVEIAITRYGGPEVLVPRRAAVRAPGSGEVRILQTAVGVNFIDVYCRRGSFDLVPPGVPGLEAAGLVESVGLGVSNVRAGDRVATPVRRPALILRFGRCAPIFSFASRNPFLTKRPPPPAERNYRRVPAP